MTDKNLGGRVLVIMVGPAGCGKSTWAASVPGFEVVSSDSIREELFGDEAAQLEPGKVFAEAYERTKTLLDAGNSVIFDATNCRPMYRKNVLYEVGAHADFVVGVVYKDSLKKCLSNNLRRNRQVPEKVIKGMYYGLMKEPPTVVEGFDLIVRLSDAASDIVQFLKNNFSREQAE